MRLGDLLVAHGVIAREVVDAALARQRKQGKRLGHHLVAMGAITTAQLADALGKQHQLEAAVDACARSLKDLRQRHGELHLATNQACYELAHANLAAGYTNYALALGEHVLQQYRLVLGRDHERTLEATQFVAEVRKTMSVPAR